MRIGFAISCAATTSLLVALACPRVSTAQVNVQVQVAVPTIRFETAPVLVEVSPGIQVVPEYEQEVFFVDGWYWHRAGRIWYRTRDHRGGWVMVHRREVPHGLAHFPPGRYKHFRPDGPHMHGPGRGMAPPPPPGHRREPPPFRAGGPGPGPGPGHHGGGHGHFEPPHGEPPHGGPPRGGAREHGGPRGPGGGHPGPR